MLEQDKFIHLGRARRIWAVGALHGDAERLTALHEVIGRNFRTGDRIVYLGNMIGRGPDVRQTVEELLAFRRAILAQPSVIASDIVYLLGGQEEMWRKLLQLQFAPNPSQVLAWMRDQGVGATLAAYGGDGDQGMIEARAGAVSLTKWTGQLRANQKAASGHDTLMTQLRHAAYTASEGGTGLLFVNAGVDPARPLGAQGDSFWWGGRSFHKIDGPVGEFARVVRGYDPLAGGVNVADHAVTLDGGSGRGGGVAAGCFLPDGTLLDLMEA